MECLTNTSENVQVSKDLLFGVYGVPSYVDMDACISTIKLKRRKQKTIKSSKKWKSTVIFKNLKIERIRSKNHRKKMKNHYYRQRTNPNSHLRRTNNETVRFIISKMIIFKNLIKICFNLNVKPDEHSNFEKAKTNIFEFYIVI